MLDERAVPLPNAMAGRDNRMRGALRGTACVAVLGIVALLLPSLAAAHGRAATVALDYRLPVDSGATGWRVSARAFSTGPLAAPDRSRQRQRVVVLGDLGEPMLRVADGVWVNQSSPTAQANRLVSRPAKGWKRVAAGRASPGTSTAWRPRRPCAGSYGRVAHWNVPLLVDGRRVAISGSFVRVPRPALWPWAAGVAVVIGLAAVAMRRQPGSDDRDDCSRVLAGLAGLTAQTRFPCGTPRAAASHGCIVGAVFAIAAIAAGRSQ